MQRCMGIAFYGMTVALFFHLMPRKGKACRDNAGFARDEPPALMCIPGGDNRFRVALITEILEFSRDTTKNSRHVMQVTEIGKKICYTRDTGHRTCYLRFLTIACF